MRTCGGSGAADPGDNGQRAAFGDARQELCWTFGTLWTSLRLCHFDFALRRGPNLFRRILLILATFLAAPSAQADAIKTLLKAAHAADFAGVEVQIKEAPDRTAQRDLVWALAATDPDTAAFTKAWVAAQPDNPTALSARAWSLYWAAAQIRGERVRRHT